MAERSWGWGFLGTGTVAGWFAPEVGAVEGCHIAAVAGRSREAAAAFASRHSIPTVHATYDEVLADPEVDIVYVALPNPLHAPWAVRALARGKAVLCEKPFTVNGREANEVVAAARANGVFLMEAMRARFVPAIRRAGEAVASGLIGDIRLAHVDFGGTAPSRSAADRWLSPALGGGALLDMGVYALSLLTHLMGLPDSVRAIGTMSVTGVDLACSAVLGFAGGAHALMSTSLDAARPGGLVLVGTEGRLELTGPIVNPAGGRLVVGDSVERLDVVPFASSMRYQAAEVSACLRAGTLESDVMPLTESVAVVELCDEIRRQIGLRYPFEQAGEPAPHPGGSGRGANSD